MTLDLFPGHYKPYNKDLHNHRYVNNESNHPHTILNNLHKFVQFRLPANSSNKEIVDNKINYIKASELSNHEVNMEYLEKKTKKVKIEAP